MDRELAAELARMAAAEERMREPALGKEGNSVIVYRSSSGWSWPAWM